MSFLFHKTHEQSYVAHATSFALCIGPYVKHPACLRRRPAAHGAAPVSRNFPLLTLATSLVLHALFKLNIGVPFK
jgi:hypothetical protein